MTIDAATIPMPNGLREYYQYIRTDNQSINGTMQRNQINKKKIAELTWTNLLPASLATILVWADDLNSHAYSNTQSRYGTWAFTGLVTITDPGEYLRGSSYMTSSFTVVIREV